MAATRCRGLPFEVLHLRASLELPEPKKMCFEFLRLYCNTIVFQDAIAFLA